MTFLETLKIEKKWSKRALIINFYHKLMSIKRKKWTIRLTAKKLQISIGQVSEAIKLAQAIIDDPSLEGLKREDALRMIKK